MSTYAAPIQDIRFVLDQLMDLEAVSALPAFRETAPDPEVVQAILQEASNLAGGVLAPLNQSGDEEGSRLVDGEVVTPEGFADAYRLFVEGGWQSLPGNPAVGGQGLPLLLATAVDEMWHAANMSFALCPLLTESANVLMEAHATPELKEIYAPRLMSGEWTGTMNLTEPQAGSDLSAIKTKATPNGDHYLIQGQKIFITWGDHAMAGNIVHLVLARLPDAPDGIRGISLFLVPKFIPNNDGAPGERNDVKVISLEKKLGIHGSPTCVMSYGEHDGAIGYLVGKENEGMACMFTMMNHARLAVGLQGLSISEGAYQQALAYARERAQGHVPGEDAQVTIIRHADVRRMLMTMKAGTEAMRGLCYMTAAAADYMRHSEDEDERNEQEQLFALLTPIVKGWCTELSTELTSLGVQIHGGMGYVEESGAPQFFRDARITPIYEGTNGIQAHDLVDRKVLRDKGTVLKRALAEMNALVPSLNDCSDDNVEPVARHFAEALEHLERAADAVVDRPEQDPDNAGAVAHHFMMLAGTAFAGWQMARAALIAVDRLAGGTDDTAFYETKLVTARFFAEHLLTRSHFYVQSILAGSESTMNLDEDRF